MKRSAGVTTSAVAVLLGCGLTLVSTAFMALGLAEIASTGAAPQITKSFGAVMILFMLALAVWGTATGVNLLHLREWSRISMLVFSGLLLVISIPGIIMMLFVPFPAPPSAPDPELMRRVMAATRVGMVVFYALLTVLGVWWLYFFNSRAVKEQFRGAGAPAPSSPSAWVPAGGAAAAAVPKRPISITIIAYLSLAGACVLPLIQLMHVPMMFMGIFYTGWKASLIIMGFMTAQLLIAYGLLRLEPWGRSLAIYYFNFGIFNSIISVILPGAQARFDAATAMMQGTLGVPATSAKFPIWSGLIFGLPLIAIQLWFVVTRKQAFQRRGGASAPPL
ncbi:MAG: hypothetical protein WA211_13345 [Candidatus Acidiferrales bacterium]